MILVSGSGQIIDTNNAAEIATLISTGHTVIRANGTVAHVMIGGAGTPDRITIDGVPLLQMVSAGGGGSAGAGTVTLPPASPGVFNADGVPYRLIFPHSPGRVDTGGTYPGCSIGNTAACRPMQFGTIQEAYDFAASHGEEPLLVGSEQEAWDIVDGRKVPGGMSTLTMVALGVGAFLLLRKR